MSPPITTVPPPANTTTTTVQKVTPQIQAITTTTIITTIITAIRIEKKEMKRSEWISGYVSSRVKTPSTPIMQKPPPQKSPSKKMSSLSPRSQKAYAMSLRSNRAQSGMKCPNCGLVGYYRVNCPKCESVKIDIEKDSWRPTTPDSEKKLRSREREDNSPTQQLANANFKTDSAVRTKTGVGDKAFFWRKEDVVWQFDEEELPEAYDNANQSTVPFDTRTATVSDVMRYFGQTENRGVSHQNTFIPSKLKNVEDSDKKLPNKDDIMAGANNNALASALANTLGGSYVSKDALNEDSVFEQNSITTKNPSKLSEGTYLWDAPSLHSNDPNRPTEKGLSQKSSILSMKSTSPSKGPTRTRAEANLHLVLHRLIAIVKSELGSLVPDFASSMLQPPPAKVGKNYYNSAVFKEHKTYFKKQMVKKESMMHKYQYKGNYKTTDKLKYVFDRGPGDKETLISGQRAMHEDKTGRHTSLHGVWDWLSVLSRNDQYATTGRRAERAEMKLEKQFKDQKKWVAGQQKYMEAKRERCNHLLALFEEELNTDEKREIELLNLKGKQFGKRNRELVKERSEAADKCMRIMIEYNFVPGVEIADYLRYTVELGKMCGVKVKSKQAEMESYKKKLATKRAKKISEEDGGSPKNKDTKGRRNSMRRGSTMKKLQPKADGDSDSDSVSSSGSSSYSSSSSSSGSSSSSYSSDEDQTPRTKSKKKEEKQQRRTERKAKLETEKKKEEEAAKKKKKNNNMNSGMAEYGGKKAKKKKKKIVDTYGAPRRTKRQQQVLDLARKLHMDPKDPYVQTYFPSLPTEAKSANTAKAVRNFTNAGFKSNIRKGLASKDEGRIPALLPLPDCYSTGPVAVESEKSYLAAKIMNDLRARQVDSNTGDFKREAVPLFHRVSMDEGETYSDLVGRPFHFMDPNRTHKPMITGGYS
ncbi:hypothetical protein TL16_g01239 [Triparma laevis f. inornata]|uniref:Uncharacterized protein n=1 Tax=Triparma laevis f. inornata TaxID=1714386 RepID=A0A9W6ZM58_9STRA|nr:hypothetical protein TL16_g01239 [Triparma laevis f. inornata]